MAKDKSNENEYLELIYNLHHICEALIYDGPESAEDMLRQRMSRIAAENGGSFPVTDGFTMVTSLNRCIYDFFQFYMHISFTECCNSNRVNECSAKTAEDVFEAASKVLRDYYAAYINSRGLSSHLEKARSYIRSHLSDTLTLDSVGAAIHISGGYLSRIFSTLAGQSFCDYVKDERMALARQLLIGTDLSVESISEQCGFSSPGYFATVFKGYMGKCPLEYRNRAWPKKSLSCCPVCNASFRLKSSEDRNKIDAARKEKAEGREHGYERNRSKKADSRSCH